MTDLEKSPGVRFRPGQVAVFRPPMAQLAPTRVDLPAVKPRGETWRGPEQVLRARLRDEARDRRVKPFGDIVETPGLPRGWVAMRVYFTDEELSRDIKPKRRLWPWLVASAVGALSGIGVLGYWLYLQIHAAVVGALSGAGAAAGIVLALLLIAAGGTTVVTVVTQVTVKRGWF